MEPQLASSGFSTPSFTSAIPEKKRGGTLRQAIQVRNDMSSRIDTVRKAQETFKEYDSKASHSTLKDEHVQLTKQISIIDSKVNSFVSPIRNFFRGKEQTAELKQVQQDLIKFKQTLERTNEFSTSHLQINNDKDWKFLQKNFPYLIHTGPASTASFGMTPDDPIPRVPFLIQSKSEGGYIVIFPPATPNEQPTTTDIISLSEFKRAYKENLEGYSQALSKKLSNEFSNSLLRNLSFKVSFNSLEMSYGDNTKKFFTLSIDRNIDFETAKKLVSEFVNKTIEETHSEFKSEMSDANNNYYSLLPKRNIDYNSVEFTVDGINMRIVRLNNQIKIEGEFGEFEFISPKEGYLKNAVEDVKQKVINKKEKIKQNINHYNSLSIDRSTSEFTLEVNGQKEPVKLMINWSDENKNQPILEITYSTDRSRKIYVQLATDNLEEKIEEAKTRAIKLRENNQYFKSLPLTHTEENSITKLSESKLIYEDGFEVSLKFDNIAKKYLVKSNYSHELYEVYIEKDSLETTVKELEQKHASIRSLVTANRQDYEALQPNQAGKATIEPNLEFTFEWKMPFQKVIISNPSNKIFVEVLLSEPDSLKKGIDQLKKKIKLIESNKTHYQSFTPVSGAANKRQLVYRYGLIFHIEWDERKKEYVISNNYQNPSFSYKSPSLNNYHHTVRRVSIENESLEQVIKDIKKEVKPRRDLIKSNYAYYKTLNPTPLYPNDISDIDEESGLFKDEGFGMEITIDWNYTFNRVVLGNNVNGYVQVVSLVEVDSLKKGIDDLKKSFSWRKDIIESYSRLEGVQDPIIKPDGNLKPLKIRDTEVLFKWSPDGKRLTLTDSSGKPLTHFSYPEQNSMQEVLKNLEDKIVLKSGLRFAQLNSDALKTVSEAVSPTKLERHPNYPKHTDLTSKLRKFAAEADLKGQVLNPNAESSILSEESIRKNVKNLADTIDKYHNNHFIEALGIPNPGPERDKYFEDLEARLTHVMAALDDKEKENIPLVVVELGVGGSHCVGRWKGMVDTFYRLYTRPPVDMTTIDLHQWLQIQIDQKKSDTVDHMVASVRSDHPDHVRMRYINRLKEADILIPGWQVADYKDILERSGGGLYDKEDIVASFQENMSLSDLLLENKSKLNALLNDSNLQVKMRFGVIISDHINAGFPKLLANLPSNEPEPKQYKNLLEQYNAANQNQKGELIANLKLVTEDDDFIMNGVTTRGMLLLMWQTGQIKLKEQELAQLFLSLPA